MAQIHHAFAKVDPLIREAKYEDAKSLLARDLEEDPTNRETQIYLLLVNVHENGPISFEDEIDRLRSYENLTERERDLIRQIFVLGFKSAEKDGREEQAMVYQRLLRRLLLNQSLDQTIPRTKPILTAPNGTKSHGVVAQARQPAIVRMLRPAMAGASATAASAIGSAREKIHTSKRPWQATARTLKNSAAATMRLAADFGTGISTRIGKTRRNAASLSRRRQPRFDGRKSRLRMPHALIGAAAVSITIPLVYYLSLDRPSSAIVPETSPPAVSSTEPTLLPAANSETQTPGVNEPEKLQSEPLGSRVTEHLPALRRLYTAAIRHNPDLMGSLSLRIKMDPNGNVIDAAASHSRLSDSDFAESVLAEARKWRFLKHNSQGGVFTVPLLFVPDDMDQRTILRWEETVDAENGKTNIIRPAKANTDEVNQSERPARVVRRKDKEVTTKKVSDKAGKRDQRTIQVAEYKTRRLVPLREEPRFSSTTTEHLGPGTPISVLETKGDWLKIRTGSGGSVGYVRKEYLTSTGGSE